MKVNKLKSILETYTLKEEANKTGRQYFELNVSDLELSDLTGRNTMIVYKNQAPIEYGFSRIRNILLNPNSVIVYYGLNQASDDVQQEFLKIIEVASQESDIYEVSEF